MDTHGRLQIIARKREINKQILSMINDETWRRELVGRYSLDENGNVEFYEKTDVPEEIGILLAELSDLSNYQDELKKEDSSQADNVVTQTPSVHSSPLTRRRLVWLGQPGELAALAGFLKDNGWLDAGSSVKDFFETVHHCFTIKNKTAGKEASAKALRMAYERITDGSKKKPSPFEPLRQIKKL